MNTNVNILLIVKNNVESSTRRFCGDAYDEVCQFYKLDKQLFCGLWCCYN